MKKKQDIIQAAVRIFAEKGFEGTTTLQIASEARVTEPLIFYHFKGKEGLFSHILEISFREYFSRLDTVKRDLGTQFERIKALLDLHFRLVEEMPDQAYLVVSTCPAKLNYPEHLCTKNIHLQRERLEAYIADCLENGIKSGEFQEVPVHETANFFIAMINGLFRQRGLGLDELDGMRDVTVGFCKRSLVKG